MNTTSISGKLAELKATRNPLCLCSAIWMLTRQRRIYELVYGIFCGFYYRPSEVNLHPDHKLQSILNNCKSLLPHKDSFSRENLIQIFGENYAARHLPTDFYAARSESIACGQDWLIIGEYGDFRKRLVYISRESCVVNSYYTDDAYVRHIHAVHKASFSCDVLVTTGDTAKYLDLWSLEHGRLVFKNRLRKTLAGHTAITEVEGTFYLGTDFSSRPNYIERLVDGKRFFFPRQSYKMHVILFRQYLAVLS